MAELSQGQHASRAKGKEVCIYHRKTLELVCETCEDLACVKCVTSIHKGHDFCHLNDKVPEVKEEIKTFIDNTENIKIPNIQQVIITAKDILNKEKVNFDDLEKAVLQQVDKLKQSLELLSSIIISSLQQLRTENMEIISGHIKALETLQEDFNGFLNECKHILQSESRANIYDVRSDITSKYHALKPLPDKPSLGSACFIANTLTLDHLTQCFGTVTISHPEHRGFGLMEQPISHPQPPSESTIHSVLKGTKVIKEFRSPCIDAICNTSDERVYTQQANKVTQLNENGEVKQTIEYQVYISDVSVSPTTQHIWTCSDEDCSVMECVPGHSPMVRFNTDNKPRCLCVTEDDFLLIGMSNNITKYTTQGKILLTIKPYWFGYGQSKVKSPRRITECRVTHNVAVADMDDKDDGGNDNRCVLVVDKDLREIFRYDGDIPSKYQPTIKSGDLGFYPYDVKYDSVGNLAISDHYRNSVHLLSGCGDYLRLIYTDDTEVWNIGIDVNNVLWVVTGSLVHPKVKLLQYNNTDA